jgi:hypothetical protein
MTVQTISVQLPDDMVRRMQRVAVATNQSLEAVLVQTIRGNLPPSLDDLSGEAREQVADLPARADDDPWAIVGETLPPRHIRRQQHLPRKVASETLTQAEQDELTRLREATDRHVIRRSFALALLKWRGQTLPLSRSACQDDRPSQPRCVARSWRWTGDVAPTAVLQRSSAFPWSSNTSPRLSLVAHRRSRTSACRATAAMGSRGRGPRRATR